MVFGLIKYEEYVVSALVNSNYARNTLTTLIMYNVTWMLRFHLSLLLCWLFTTNNVLDLVSPIMVNIVLSYASNFMYQYVSTHREFYENIALDLINDHSIERVKLIKRYMFGIIFCYVMIAAWLVEITSELIILSTIQTAIAFVICDVVENYQTFKVHVNRWLSRIIKPKTRISDSYVVVDDYRVPPVYRSVSPLRKIKAETPPRRRNIMPVESDLTPTINMES